MPPDAHQRSTGRANQPRKRPRGPEVPPPPFWGTFGRSAPRRRVLVPGAGHGFESLGRNPRPHARTFLATLPRGAQGDTVGYPGLPDGRFRPPDSPPAGRPRPPHRLTGWPRSTVPGRPLPIARRPGGLPLRVGCAVGPARLPSRCSGVFCVRPFRPGLGWAPLLPGSVSGSLPVPFGSAPGPCPFVPVRSARAVPSPSLPTL